MTFRAARRRKREINDARASSIGFLLRRAAEDGGSVYGPAPLWLALLTAAAPAAATAHADWPRTPKELGRTFAALSEGLRASGVILSRSRALICGHVHRVWRVDSLSNYNQTPKPRAVLLGGQTHQKPPSAAHIAKMSALKAENDRKHSERTGAPATGPTVATKPRRKTTVESCARVHAVEAPHVGAATEKTQIGNTSARRLWAICPNCEKRVRFLYQLPSGGKWACKKCLSLTTQAQQQKGTRAEFAAWLTPERWERMSAKHPALKSFYDETGADFRANVASLDWDKADPIKRLELVRIYATEANARAAFERARMDWSERFEARAQAVGEQIHADLWTWWKSRNRPRSD